MQSGRGARRGAELALGIVAAGAGAMTALELYRAGVRWGPLGKPMVYHFAAVTAVAIALRAILRGGRVWLPVAFVALTFALYLANDQRLMSGDTQPATLVPYALVRHGTLALDDVVPVPRPAWVLPSRGHVWSQYPIATGILALPVYLPAALGPGAPGFPPAEKVAAALLAAVSAGFVLSLARRLGLSTWPAVLVASAYAFGSTVFSGAAQAMWQHTGGVLALAAALYCIVWGREDARAEPWAGFCLALAVAARPTNGVAALALGLVAAARGRPAAYRVAAGAAIPLLLLAAYHTVAFGAPWRTGYAGQAAGFGAHFLAGLVGTLFSPTRGLVTFVPWSILALAGLCAAARRERLYAAALVGVASIVLVHAAWDDWPGGWGYGPRIVTDAMPLVALGLVPVLERWRRSVFPALLVAVAFSIWLAWLGAFRQYEPPGSDVYLGGDVHAMEWWRYPPATLFGRN